MTDREKLIEAMARRYARKYGGLGPTMEADMERVEKTWRRYSDEMETALDAIEAFGCVVVPRDATAEMRDAGRQAINRIESWGGICAAIAAASPYAKEKP